MQMYKVSILLIALAPSAFAVSVSRAFLAGKLDLVKTAGSVKKGYGPSNCVNVDRSKTGTCVLRTACEPNVDLEKTEFAFLCVLKDGEVQKHSYGEGGFGAEETFDTSVSCEQCLLPTMALSLEKATAMTAEEASAKDEDKEDAEDAKEDEEAGGAPAAAPAAAAPAAPGAPAAKKELPVDLKHEHLTGKNESKREVYLKSVFEKHPNSTGKTSTYGPDGCISTYVSPKNTCMMKTECKKQADALKNYDFGLTCVDEDGKSVRHLFGTNSFDPEETFDTLIDCKLCIGLDVSKMEKKESLAVAVGKLKEEVKELAKGMEEVKTDVKKLNGKVFPEAAAPAAADAAKFILHKVEQKDAEVLEKKDSEVEKKDEEAVEKKDAEVADDAEEEAPAPVTHKHHKKHHNLAHKKAKKAKHHHHKHHKKVHHRRHKEEADEDAPSDDSTEPQASEDDSDAAPKPAVEESEPAESQGEDDEADGW